MTTVKCISLWQPWALLCVLRSHPDLPVCVGEKEFETRSWSTPYRGPLLIHASKRFTQEERDVCRSEPFRSVLVKHGFNRLDEVPLGAVVGLVRLQGVHRTEHVVGAGLEPQERAFGNYAPGRFAWHLVSPVRLPEPLPYRGQQGLFDVPAALLPGHVVEAARGMADVARQQRAPLFGAAR